MPGRESRRSPRDWAEPGDWPDGPLASGAPPSAAAAQGVSLRLRAALVPTSARKAAAAAGLSPSTVTGIVHGAAWPDIDTLARLEHALGARLWGDEHRAG